METSNLTKKRIKDYLEAGKRFDGLIVHINNFDVVLSDSKEKKGVIRFFQEVPTEH